MDDDFYNCSWGRWMFSSEAKKRIDKLKLAEVNKDTNSRGIKKSCLESLIQKLIGNTSEYSGQEEEEKEEYFADSDVSSDIDDAEWDELKALTKKYNLSNNIKRLEKLNIKGDVIDGEDEKVIRVAVKNETAKIDGLDSKIDCKIDADKLYNMSTADGLLLNFSQSQIVEIDPSNENDIVYSLKEALENEDVADEEITALLSSSEITEQQLLEVWSQLESCSSRLRLCFCVFPCEKSRAVFLCHKLLLPWFINDKLEQVDEIVQKISEILPKFPEIAIKSLIVPLICNRESTMFTKDIFLLRDMMAHLRPREWNLLLKELIEDIKILKWHLPLLKLIVESISEEEINESVANKLLISLGSVVNEFSSDRDFGLLVMAVINNISKKRNVPEIIVEQLKYVAENYKGSMQFKIVNSIKQLPKH